MVIHVLQDSTSKCSSADMSIISKQEQQSTCNDPASQQTSLNYSPNLTLVDALEVCGFKYGRDDTTESRCGIKDASKEAIEDVYNSLVSDYFCVLTRFKTYPSHAPLILLFLYPGYE